MISKDHLRERILLLQDVTSKIESVLINRINSLTQLKNMLENNNSVLPELGDVILYSKETVNGLKIKVGVLEHVIKRRNGTLAYRVNPFNYVSKNVVEADNLVPVVAYIPADLFKSLGDNQDMFLNIVEPPAPPASVVDDSEVDCGCDTSCAV